MIIMPTTTSSSSSFHAFTDDGEWQPVPQPGTTELGYDEQMNPVALLHQIGDGATPTGMPFDLRIENEGEHFSIHIDTLAPAAADGTRLHVTVFSCHLRREDLAALVSAPPAC